MRSLLASSDVAARPLGRLAALPAASRDMIELLNQSWSRRRGGRELWNHIRCNSLRLPRFVPRCAQNVPSQTPDSQRTVRRNCPVGNKSVIIASENNPRRCSAGNANTLTACRR